MEVSGQNRPWYQRSFRRNLIDMHIPDWNEEFMSRFDPEQYLAMLELADVDTAMIYTSSCLGICYWPTTHGHMHAGLKGRDVIGELVAGCHHRGINVILYLNNWSGWAYDTHPEWRVINQNGLGSKEWMGQKGRYGVVCPNSGYRRFILDQVSDLCTRYHFEGLWIDMIHWPGTVCYCGHCRRRYMDEAASELPRTVDWHDPGWIRFQRTRERWMAEFAGDITATARALKPSISVGHQCAGWFSGWQHGLTNAFFRQTDYVSGDFYGDALHQSLTCKALYHLSEQKPFEFMTSRCPDLTHHTTMKSREQMEAHLYSAMANGGGFLFIDAIDPVGTLDRRVYELMGEIFRQSRRYEPYLTHESTFCQDVAIYISFESVADLADNGRAVAATSPRGPYQRGVFNLARALLDDHLPFGVLTRKNLSQLADFQVLVLPDTTVLDAEEAEAIRAFVRAGGSLLATRRASLYDKHTGPRADFLLGDLFGVTYRGESTEEVSYITPLEDDIRFGSFGPERPVMLSAPQTLVETRGKAQVLATVTRPYTDPGDPTRCASAISNPPGIATVHPAVVSNRYGEGRVLYLAGNLERMEFDPHRQVLSLMIRSLLNQAPCVQIEAPRSVEATLFRQPHRQRYVVYLLNYQHDLPNIPVNSIRVRLRTDGLRVSRVALLPEETALAHGESEGLVEFTVPALTTFAMVAVDYR